MVKDYIQAVSLKINELAARKLGGFFLVAGMLCPVAVSAHRARQLGFAWPSSRANTKWEDAGSIPPAFSCGLPWWARHG
jgi:hypothetical protein